jgi:hypothetical protein
VIATPLIFLGASPFREVGELVRDINDVAPTFDLRAVLDDDPSLHGTEVEGLPILGSLDTVHDHGDALFAFAIGSHRSRLACYAILQRLACRPNAMRPLYIPGPRSIPRRRWVMGRSSIAAPWSATARGWEIG